MMLLWMLSVPLLGYLIGSVNFAVIFSKWFTGKDIRESGSGNAGATNMARTVGLWASILTFLCDMLKGALAAFLGQQIFTALLLAGAPMTWSLPLYGAYLGGLSCVIGHRFPLFFRFRGGKGVATTAGLYLICCPPALLCGFAVFAVVMALCRIVSVSSLSAAAVTVALSLLLYDPSADFWPQAICSLMLFVILFVCHLPNVIRLVRGQEKPLTVRRK